MQEPAGNGSRSRSVGNLADTSRRAQPDNPGNSPDDSTEAEDWHMNSQSLKSQPLFQAPEPEDEDWRHPRPVIQNGKPVTGTQWPDVTVGISTRAADAELNGGTNITAKPSLYIAGPMTGFENHNYPLFSALAACLRAQGYVVKNPAESFGGDQTRELYEYIELNLEMVMDTEAIVLMPGWRDSEYARMEAAVAKALNHAFYEATVSEGAPPDQADSWSITETGTPATTAAEGIETDARALVFGERDIQYGPPTLDFTCMGRKWAATLSAHLQAHVDDIPPEIVAVMLTDLKTTRQARTPEHRDSRVDAVGYQLCLDRIVTGD
jgi:Domain of unknown function (DUF4406)/Domain of unknown function (DUF6378)